MNKKDEARLAELNFEKFLEEFEALRKKYLIEICKIGESVVIAHSYGNKKIISTDAITANYCDKCGIIR